MVCLNAKRLEIDSVLMFANCVENATLVKK